MSVIPNYLTLRPFFQVFRAKIKHAIVHSEKPNFSRFGQYPSYRRIPALLTRYYFTHIYTFRAKHLRHRALAVSLYQFVIVLHTGHCCFTFILQVSPPGPPKNIYIYNIYIFFSFGTIGSVSDKILALPVASGAGPSFHVLVFTRPVFFTFTTRIF